MLTFSAPSQRLKQQAEEPDLGLPAVAAILWRGKWVVAVMAAIGLLAGKYYIENHTIPRYAASAELALNIRDDSLRGASSELGGLMLGTYVDPAVIRTELRVLNSRTLAEKLVDTLDLTADPEFNPWLRVPEPSLISQVVNRASAGLPWLRRLVGPEEEAVVSAPESTVLRNTVVSQALSAYSVASIDYTYSFFITAETTDPAKSALIANTLADLYIQSQIDQKYEATERATVWLTARVAELKAELELAEARIKDFVTDNDLITQEMLVGLNRQLRDFRQRGREQAGVVTENAAELARLEAALAVGTEAAMRTALAETQGGDPRGVGAANTEITPQQFERLLLRARLDLDRSRSQLAALEKQIAELEPRVQRRANELGALQQLEREAEAARLIYQDFLARLKETSVQQGIHQPDSRMISAAIVPGAPSRPRRMMVLGIATLVGALVGVLLVVLRELRRGFRTAEELEQATGMVVLGQIPSLPIRRRRKVLDYIVSMPNSQQVEAVRNVRTSLLLSTTSAPKVIMVTSTLPNEGKTTFCLALAQNLSAMGSRVLLIEGDIRRRTLSQYFDAREHPGIVSAVTGEVPLEEAIYRPETLDADVLGGEGGSVNAADFLSSEAFRSFIGRMREQYDFVVIDTPPVLVVPDARIIGASSDAVVYVVRWDYSKRGQVAQGLRELTTVNIAVRGLVLNQVDQSRMRKYGYGGYYGGVHGARKYYNQ